MLIQKKEQMNSVNDSGECQEVESTHSGKSSDVSSRQVIPCCRSILSRDVCPLIHGIHVKYRKTFLVINVLHLIRLKIIIKEFTIARYQERISVTSW